MSECIYVYTYILTLTLNYGRRRPDESLTCNVIPEPGHFTNSCHLCIDVQREWQKQLALPVWGTNCSHNCGYGCRVHTQRRRHRALPTHLV